MKWKGNNFGHIETSSTGHNSGSNQRASAGDALYLGTQVPHGGNYRATCKINIRAAQTPLNMRKHTVHIIFVPPIRIFNILAGINGD